MYLNDYACADDRNLGDGVEGTDPLWQEVTYAPATVPSGQDFYTSEPTYFDPSHDTAWLSAIGFTGNPWVGRYELPRETVYYGSGDASGSYLAPPTGDGVYHPGGNDVSGTSTAFMEMTPVRLWEKAHGYRQQVTWVNSQRYARYVDGSGNQVGPVVRTYKEGKFAEIIGKVVKIVAGAMVAVGAAQAAVAVAAGATAAPVATAAAAPSAAAAVPVVEAAVPAVASVAPAAAAVAPAVAAGGTSLTSIAASALPVVSTIAKGVAVVAPILKTQMEIKARQDMANAASTPLPIAPPADMIPYGGGYLPSAPQPFVPFASGGGTPAWLIPAALGGAGLLLVLMSRRRRSR
jgi:hypothetical protein